MNRNQFSLSRLMLVIAFVSVDVLIARFAFSSDNAANAKAVVFALIVPASQLAADRLLYGERRRRPFWLGFLAFGLLTALSYWPGLPLVGRLGVDGLWELYVNSASRLLWQSAWMRFVYASQSWHLAAGALMFFLPQAIAGSVGGALALACCSRKPKRSPAPD